MAEGGAQLGQGERLVQVGPAERFEELERVAAHGIPGGEDDPFGDARVLAGELRVHVAAGEVWHAQVANDDVERACERAFQRVLSRMARWAVDQTESVDSEAVEILPDGRGFRAIAGVTRLARLPWGTWIYDRGVRRQTRVWRLNGNAQDLVAVWPTAAECHLVDHRAADVVCVGDRNERTLVWRFGLVAGPTRPLAVRNVARRTGVSPDGRFVALWGKEDLVLVDLDRAEATRRPLPGGFEDGPDGVGVETPGAGFFSQLVNWFPRRDAFASQRSTSFRFSGTQHTLMFFRQWEI